MLAELPPELSIDNMNRLQKQLKLHIANGRKNGRWECTVRDAIAQMTFPAGNRP
jgi:hypothetical protein